MAANVISPTKEMQPVTVNPISIQNPILALPPVQQVAPTGVAPTTVKPYQAPTGGFDMRSWIDQGIQNAFWNSPDFAQLPADLRTYYTQLLTGQTPATRAATALEARALAGGAKSLMDNIGAAAAANNITGTALTEFYQQGTQQIIKNMGDFALKNLSEMAKTQAEGAKGLADLFKMGEDAKQNLTLMIEFYDTATRTDSRLMQTLGIQYIGQLTDLAAQDPTGALTTLINSGMAAWNQAIKDGTDPYLALANAMGPDGIAKVQQMANDAWSLSDTYAQQTVWGDIATRIVQRMGADGKPVTKSDGKTIIYDVEPILIPDPEHPGQFIFQRTTTATDGMTVSVNGTDEGVTANPDGTYSSSVTGLPVSKTGDTYSVTPFATWLGQNRLTDILAERKTSSYDWSDGKGRETLMAYVQSGDPTAINTIVNNVQTGAIGASQLGKKGDYLYDTIAARLPATTDITKDSAWGYTLNGAMSLNGQIVTASYTPPTSYTNYWERVTFINSSGGVTSIDRNPNNHNEWALNNSRQD